MKRTILLGSLALLTLEGCTAGGNSIRPGTPYAAQDCTPAFYDPQGLAMKCAVLELIGDGYTFTEGPAVDQVGNVYFTDQPNDRIIHWDWETGKLTTFLEGTGRANGMTFDANGYLITASDMYGEIRRYDLQGNYTVLVDNFEGKRLNGPNDIWIAPDGGMYFTDALVYRDWWDANDPRRNGSQVGGGYVYYLSPNGTLTRVAGMELDQSDLAGNRRIQPNGIVGSPDGRTLYVGYIFPRKTYAYDINPDGTLTNPREFADSHSDGMTVDERGNVYVTTREAGVTAFSPSGERIFNVPTGEFWTGNVAFAGPDRKTLFVTAWDAVYSLEMQVGGLR